MARTLLLAGLAAFLAACSQLTPLERQALPVPERFPPAPVAVNTSDAAKTHWRTYFSDPRLQALIQAALENNRDLRIAAARVQEARAQFAITKADRLPTIGIGPPAGAPFQFVSALPYVSVSYEVDFWGRVAGMTESARFSYLATEEAKRAVRLSLVADVASGYFELLQAEQLLDITRATVDLREQSLQLIEKSRDIGVSYDYEYQQAKGILEATRSTYANLQHQRTVANNRLDFLVGRAALQLPAGRSLEEQGLDAGLTTGLPSEVLLLRPDVMASENRLRASQADIGVARAAYFPKIALTAGFGSSNSSLASIFEGGALTVNPVVSLPALFDGGRTAAGVDAAQARKVAAVAEYEKTIQLAFREVSDQISARGTLEQQLRATKANVDAQVRRLQIALARHKAGAIGYLEVIDAQRELLAAEQSATAVKRAQLEAAVQLYKALGGGEQNVD